VFSVPEEPSANRYGDIFFIEPGSVEANRIRDQLEKDEKDLPSYDEVMPAALLPADPILFCQCELLAQM